jgi:DNA polymerase III subunit epsilon
MEFQAVDVETANADLSSICSVGIATFRDAALTETWKSLVNPNDLFDPLNVSIHGIDEEAVQGAPTWLEVFPEINLRLQGRIVVSHTPFDRVAIAKACECSTLVGCDCTWLDSARVVRRAWPEFSRSGYGLSNVAAHLRITYQAHDALEDARCAGLILLHAVAKTGIFPDQWVNRVKQPIDPSGQLHTRDGNPDGDLFGEVLVFTGTLSIPRSEAANLASAAGCRVEGGVTKRTTMLVVGDQDLRKLAGHVKSAKQLKAEELTANGQKIRVLGESDFRKVVSLANPPAPTGAKPAT